MNQRHHSNKIERLPVVLLMGATATGKTRLALELFEHLPVRIINVDSVQFYRQFDIGSAKPTLAQQQQYQLRMIDICNPDDVYSVARFYREVQLEIQQAQQQQKIALLTGGSMMYFKTLIQGLSPMPPADPIIRQQLRDQIATGGIQSLHQRLSQIDPATASRLSANDSQRIVRALEVYTVSGITIDAWHQQTPQDHNRYISLALSQLERPELHQRIEDRFHTMLKSGFVDEVSALKKRWHAHIDAPVFRSVGYKQILDYLEGEHDYNTMIDKSLIATRQLAKRQITWLRSWPNIHHLNSDNLQELAEQVVTIVHPFLPLND